MKNSSTKSPRLLAILAHPKSDSFCKSLFQKGLDTFKFLGFELDVIDLYQGDFPPVMPLEELQRGGSFETAIQDYAHKLQAADGLFIVHPDWWGGPPAILKGWLDRVLRPGVAYDYEGEEFEDKEKVGLLGGKKAYVVVTTDQAAPKSGKIDFFKQLWSDHILGFCGITESKVKVFYDIFRSEYGDRKDFLQAMEEEITAFLA
jgi:NAD(P)H dehydrogenase (quinone)